MKELMRELTSPSEVKITLLEGWNIDHIANYLDTSQTLYSFDSKKFKSLCSDYDFINNDLDFLNYDILSLEGYLYPETYKIDPYLSEKDLIRVFTDEFSDRVYYYNRYLDNTVMILASIIEAETDLIDEMKIISSVYNNRVRSKPPMKLESDPTIEYFTKRRMRPEDKYIDNPYNTYMYPLPPGPINCPRIEAIEAAVYPADTDYIFMVMHYKTGRHLFSNDYKGHLKNIRKK
tara:strand:- start:293 stop:991 length:699 start_codon:yes stop_codon:yes gene_type:complete